MRLESEQLQNTPQLLTTSFTCVEMFCRMRHNTIDTFVIQRDANKLRVFCNLTKLRGVFCAFFKFNTYCSTLENQTYPFVFSNVGLSRHKVHKTIHKSFMPAKHGNTYIVRTKICLHHHIFSPHHSFSLGKFTSSQYHMIKVMMMMMK